MPGGLRHYFSAGAWRASHAVPHDCVASTRACLATRSRPPLSYALPGSPENERRWANLFRERIDNAVRLMEVRCFRLGRTALSSGVVFLKLIHRLFAFDRFSLQSITYAAYMNGDEVALTLNWQSGLWLNHDARGNVRLVPLGCSSGLARRCRTDVHVSSHVRPPAESAHLASVLHAPEAHQRRHGDQDARV